MSSSDPENPKDTDTPLRLSERSCVLPLDQIEEFTHIAISSPSISSNDDLADIERKNQETKKTRQLLGFAISCLLVICGVVIEKIHF
jgi:hypothetical protein